MKRQYFILIFILAMGVSCFFSTSYSRGDLNFSEILAINYASAEDPVNDEKDVCLKQECTGGTTCECTGCEKGTTDCTPTCPCCDE